MPVPYEAALHVTMTGNAMTGMAGLTAKIGEADKATKGLMRSFELLAAGGILEKIGGKIKDAFKTVIDAAGDLQQVQNQMHSMGMTQVQIVEATGRAWKLATDNIHIGVQEIMELNRHSIEIFGSAEAAAEHMPMMARLAFDSPGIGLAIRPNMHADIVSPNARHVFTPERGSVFPVMRAGS